MITHRTIMIPSHCTEAKLRTFADSGNENIKIFKKKQFKTL